jgi:L-lysine 6-transaminase
MIADEVQTGCGITGSAWAYQQLGFTPDVVAFGKKTQVCGVMAGRRVDEVPDNVFAVSSRINSTWGGNLVDMVRSRRILETVEADSLFANAAEMGAYLLAGLGDLARQRPDTVRDVRGRGLMCAFSLPSPERRDAVLSALWERGVIMLGSGADSVRFRPALTVTRAEIDRALAALREVLLAAV